jgi:hypothetical protein
MIYKKNSTAFLKMEVTALEKMKNMAMICHILCPIGNILKTYM